MAARLQDYFPMIRTRKEVLEDIYSREDLTELFQDWTEAQQTEFLDFCTGVRGVKILYDGFFKAVMDPDAIPERLEDFISQVLGERVKIIKVLPAESRIADETSLSILDIVVQMEDGSIVNVEVQRIGYAFPGQRCACYSADLLLRQYKRVRSEKGKKFSYKDIKSVYTIVLFEKSPGEFKNYPEKYIHKIKARSDTGLKIELLQKYVFLPLDIFVKRSHNKVIRDKLEAWLTFFSTDKPEEIERLIQTYPEFIPMYQSIYDICRNVENVMGLFSEELKILDKNTVMYMIDEMQDTIDEQKDTIDGMQDTIDEMGDTIDEMRDTIDEQKTDLSRKDEDLSRKDEEIYRQQELIRERDQEIEELKKRLAKQ